jgi:tetratricopeptide (TPR) repeat protein
MKRISSWLVALSLAMAVPVLAQSFEGFDSGKKKKKRPKKPTATPDKKEEAEDRTEVPMPEGGLDLSKTPATEAKKPVDTKPAAAMSFDAVDVSGKTGDRQKIDAAIEQFRNDSFENAALAFSEMSTDPKFAALTVEAEYWLGKSLYKLGMYHSALGQFSKVLARGQQTKFFKTSLEWLFFIARKTVNEQVVLDEIAKYSNFEFPDRFKSEFRYLLARYNFVRAKALDDAEQKAEADKAFEEVKRLSLMVPKGDAFYPRAKYLEALAHFRENKAESALESLKEVVRVTRGEVADSSEQRNLKALRELAFMQLARTHYGARQNRNAQFYYQKIERGGPQWLEALFESSWAGYRIGQSEQALGNLITLSSPFFRDEYFPEALILKAVVYFENCRYREALTIIEDFEGIYGPVQDELDVLVGKNMEATEYFTVFDDVRKKNKDGEKITGTEQIMERILNLALTDKDLKKTVDSITELEQEIDSLGSKGDAFKFSNLAKQLIEDLKNQRVELVKRAGLMAKGKLEFELGQLKTMRANGLRIKFETTSKEKDFLEAQLAQGAQAQIIREYRYRYGVTDDQLYWPFSGEYWRDELGTYEYTLTKGCIEKQAKSE